MGAGDEVPSRQGSRHPSPSTGVLSRSVNACCGRKHDPGHRCDAAFRKGLSGGCAGPWSRRVCHTGVGRRSQRLQVDSSEESMRGTMVQVFLGLSFLLVTESTLFAQIRFIHSHSGTSSSQGAVWAAKDLGLFEKYGLNVDLVFISGGAR